MVRYILTAFPFSLCFFVPFKKDLEQGKDTEVQRLADVGRMRHESDKNNLSGICIGDDAQGNVTGMLVDQKDNWSIVVNFDAQLIIFWNKLHLQPIDERNFSYKRFLSTSHHEIMTVK
jgi:hypothetical protein